MIEIIGLSADGQGRDAQGGLHRGAAPGDRITADGITRGAHYQTPPCPHFGRCGGCVTQHVRDDWLGNWKRDHVVMALKRAGLDTVPTLRHQSPPGTRRRAVFAGRRTKKTVQLGFHAARSDAIMPIEACPLIDPQLIEALPLLRALTGLCASRSNGVRIAATVSNAGLDLDVTTARAPDRAALAGLDGFARLALDGEVALQHAPPAQSFGRAEVVPPPGAFLQATRLGEAALVAAAQTGLTGAGAIIELFAGCGTFTLPLAEQAEVHAYEGDAAAVAALDLGWRRAGGLRRVRAETRDLFRRPLVSAELRADALLLDPPRAGAAAQMPALAAADLGRIVYVSCNPTSFARDAAQLVAGGWRLDQVDVVDQFRWSAHVELVACFSPR